MNLTSKPTLSVSISKSFSYLEYHTDCVIKASDETVFSTQYSFIKKIDVENPTDYDFDDLVIHFTFNTDMFHADDIHFGFLAKNSKRSLMQDSNVVVDIEKLYHQSGVSVCQLEISLIDNTSGEILFTVIKSIKILPLELCTNNIETYPYLLAKYCITDFTSLNAIIRKAVEKNDGKPLIGYDNKNEDGTTDKNAILHEISLLYGLIHDYGISYATPPVLVEALQNVRLPNKVLSEKLATCLDYSLLMCSALLSINLHPVLITTEGHAFIGCFLNEDDFFSFVCLKPSQIQSMVKNPDKKMVLLECTCLDCQSTSTFSQAVEIGENALESYHGKFTATDINFCQKAHLKPIPIKKENEENIDFTITPAKIPESEIAELKDFQLAPINAVEDKDRFSTWEKKLLDLTTANKLVNFKRSKDGSNALEIPCFDSGELFNYLRDNAKGSVKVRLVASNNGDENEKASFFGNELEPLSKDLRQHEIILANGKAVNVKKIIKQSNSSKDETGSPTLYLALATISTMDEKERIEAPLLLLPVSLSKDRLGEDFTMMYDFDDIMLNQTFFEYIKIKLNADYSSIYGFNSTDDFLNMVNTILSMNLLECSISTKNNYISNFSFSHYVMWRDIRTRKDKMRENPAVQSLLENQSVIKNTAVTTDLSAMDMDTMNSFAAPLPYDSTQLRAILECGAGNSFILDGPPGTGKSQTIVNMIVNAFYNGKTVLFVAEKMAALEVVQNRLEKLGLGLFSLELYSSKANKQSLFSQLGKAMSLGAQVGGQSFQDKCQEIEAKKKEIQAELSLLHEKKDNAVLSLYDAILKDLITAREKEKYHLSDEFIDNDDAQKEETIHNEINDIISIAKGISGFDSTPLTHLSLTGLSYNEQDKFHSDFGTVDTALEGLKEKYQVLGGTLELPLTPSRKELEQINDLLTLCFNAKIKTDKLSEIELFDKSDAIKESLAHVIEMNRLALNLAQKIKLDSILKIDYPGIKAELDKGTNFFSRIFANGKVKKLLKPYFVDGYKPIAKEFANILEDIHQYQENHLAASQMRTELDVFFNEDIFTHLDQAESNKELFTNTDNFFKAIKAYHEEESLAKKLSTFAALAATKPLDSKIAFRDFTLAFAAFKETEETIHNEYAFDIDAVSNYDFFLNYDAFLKDVSDPANVKAIASVALINRHVQVLKEYGLEDFYLILANHESELEYWADIYENALANGYIRYYFKQKEVDEFNSTMYLKEVEHYQQLIREYNQIAVEEVINKITSKFANPTIDYKATTPIGALKKLVASNGRGMTIRNALIKYESYIRMYFPCFLMSPLSAAQYLSVDSQKFDLVIFDEASQIPTGEAVGPITRGNALIVAGDPQQMPPSNYFSIATNSVDGEEDPEEEIADSESLLDDCISIDMPRIPLAYHYRSRHESLIQFSNENFYNGNLFTFPSYDNLNSHISFRLVTPSVSKVSNDLSKEEVETILSTVREILTGKETEGKSIGIIVFNIKQQERLQNELDKFFSKNPDLQLLAEKAKDPLFIKNLENVQGDERDIIIMSIGFAKGKSGKAEIRGPIVLDKGERRLNVAASRAKERMYVISTIKGIDIDTAHSKNNGAKFLRNFLEFAEKASEAKAVETSEERKSVASYIRKALEEKGYACDLAVGASEFRIDIAVLNPETKKYILGIILDEKPMNQYISLRDRFYVQTTILESLKWQLLHVYTLDYFRYPEATISEIINEIEERKENEPKEATAAPESEIKPTTFAAYGDFDYGIKEYIYCRPGKTMHMVYDDVERDTYYANIHKAVKEIIDLESPVSYETIKNEMKEFFNISTIKAKGNDILQFHLNMVECSKSEDIDGKIFYWTQKPEESHEMTCFRSSDRDLYDIPYEEILFLMQRIIQAQIHVDKEDLLRLTAQKMNISSLTDRARRRLEYVIDRAKTEGKLPEGYVDSYPEE